MSPELPAGDVGDPSFDEWDSLLAGVLAEDTAAVSRFYDQFAGRLHAIADNQINSMLRGRYDAEDVVQSAFRSFFRGARAGRFTLSDGKRFWSLICAIVITKAREKARHHTREKRTPGRESAASPTERPDRRVAHDDELALAEQFDAFFGELDPDQQEVVRLKLDDQTNAEIARELGCSERTVTRLAGDVERRLVRTLQGGTGDIA